MTKPEILDSFYILDFDRCIGNTDALFDVFEQTIVEHTGLTAWSLRNVRHEVEAVGDSFDTATYVRAQLHMQGQEGKWREIVESFIQTSRDKEMLTPGSHELIHWLDQQHLAYGILTYGEETWQKLKLRAAGLEKVPQLITTNKHKGSVLQTWQRPDGTFKLPLELGGSMHSSVVLIDDKAVSFDNFPAYPSHGYWVLGKRRILPSQEGSVPENVLRFTSLRELLEFLNNNYTGV